MKLIGGNWKEEANFGEKVEWDMGARVDAHRFYTKRLGWLVMMAELSSWPHLHMPLLLYALIQNQQFVRA